MAAEYGKISAVISEFKLMIIKMLMNHEKPSIAVSILVALTLILQACVSIPPRRAVPMEQINQATVPGGPTARMWGDAAPADLTERLEIFRHQIATNDDMDAQTRPRKYLSISGGGANGAFGAGLLKGWSESGTRPEMWIVTGISTGALIAPYAFLGSDYDDELEDLYTTLSTKDLIKKRSLIVGITSDALADTQPMRDLLKKFVDKAMIAETDESAQLIRDVMLASASIPGMFPPVRITVRVGEQEYDELHVDGGVSSQVFLYPAQLDLRAAANFVGVSSEQSVYVIRNSILYPRWSKVDPKVGPVVRTSIETLIRTQGMGDLYRIYLGAKRDEMPFRLAYIPGDFNLKPEEDFDPKYMRALFDLAYELSRDGYDWETSPPGIILP